MLALRLPVGACPVRIFAGPLALLFAHLGEERLNAPSVNAPSIGQTRPPANGATSAVVDSATSIRRAISRVDTPLDFNLKKPRTRRTAADSTVLT
jgi:hypothetical protein